MRPAAAFVLAALAALPVHALEISPVRVSVPAGPGHAELWLANSDDTAWTGQARLYRWEQSGDQERLWPAEDVAVSPPRLAIGPGQHQRVRLVRLGAAPAATQQAYRLIISPAPGAGGMRYSLPVFLQPGQAAPPVSRLQVSATDSPTGARLRLYNDGDGHAHLADLVFVDARGQRQPLILGLAGYILPRSARTWPLPPRPDGYVGGQFRARLDDAAEAALPAAPAEIAPSADSRL